jgi:pimeloyl-ACP methyl ester carboxylesterase
MTALLEREVDRAAYDPEAPARQLVAIFASEPRNELLKKVRAPSLVIHGADDPLVPVEGGKDTAACISGCELVIVPGMAHDFTNALVPIYLQYLGDFLSRVERKKAA